MRSWLSGLVMVAVAAVGHSTFARADSVPPPTSGMDEPQHRSPPDVPEVLQPPDREPAPPDIIAPGSGGSAESGTPEVAWSEPGQRLARARAEIPSNPADSAQQLEQVSRQLEEYRNYVTGNTRERLSEAHQRLDQLAFDVRSKDVTSSDQANPSIAEAFSAIAAFHCSRAAEQWEHRNTQLLGEELAAAAHYLERAAELTGRGPATSTVAAVRDARRLANRLAEGTRVAPSDVNETIGDLGQAIDRVARQIKPQQRTR